MAEQVSEVSDVAEQVSEVSDMPQQVSAKTRIRVVAS